MQILIFSLLIIALVFYVIYRIKKSFTKKELINFTILIILIIGSFIYYDKNQEERFPNAFKKFYLEHNNLQIEKLSYSKKNLEVLNSTKGIYTFNYIILKDEKEYFCEAKDIEVVQIEDEFVFKNFKEECRVK